MLHNSVKSTAHMTYGERSALALHPLTQRLFSLMENKQTNLALSADVTSSSQLLNLANTLGPDICILKTHIDIINDYTAELPIQLRQIAEKHNFLLFEDRKFADIGNTVMHQYEGGIYRINEWAHITNAHTLPGFGIVEGLKEAGLSKGNGLLLLAQLSSKGNLINKNYTESTVEMALNHLDFVIGFICQEKLTEHPSLMHMTPGVQMNVKGDALGQQYNSPNYVIGEKGSDVIIVGRGIFQNENPKNAATTYREEGWLAYEQRCKTS